jgi:hypothetical protein
MPSAGQLPRRPHQQPHLRTDELASLLGVKQTTMANKGRLIMDTLRIGLLDPAPMKDQQYGSEQRKCTRPIESQQPVADFSEAPAEPGERRLHDRGDDGALS